MCRNLQLVPFKTPSYTGCVTEPEKSDRLLLEERAIAWGVAIVGAKGRSLTLESVTARTL
jgi:hypothetical protein